MKRLFDLIIILVCGLFIASCKPVVQGEALGAFSGLKLTPFQTATSTPTVTPTSENAPTATLAPTMTPTPITYVLKANDTLFGIAARYGITVAELEAANPGIKPYSLSVGKSILIPAAKGGFGTQAAPTPTPAAVILHSASCVRSLTGGYHCWALVENEQETDLENLTAEFRLIDPSSGNAVTLITLLPVNLIPAGSSIPFYTYFPPPVFGNARVEARVLTALQVDKDGVETITLTVKDPVVTISADGLSAKVEGTAKLKGEGLSVKKTWVLAVAYSADDQVVGLRRSEAASTLKSGESLEFSLDLYSFSGKIERVEVFCEGAR